MPIFPIIEWQLRRALVRENAMQRWFTAGLAAGAVLLLFMGLDALTGSPRLSGTELFGSVFLYVGVIGAGVESLRRNIDVLSVERRNGTLELLILSGLRPREIFLSKFLSSFLVMLYQAAALFPVLLAAAIIGRVSPEVFWIGILLLPVLIFFALGLALLGSSICQEEGHALVLAMVTGVVLCLLAPGVRSVHQALGGTRLPEEILLLSPAYGAWAIYGGAVGASSPSVWLNMGVTVGLGVLLLIVAGKVLVASCSSEKRDYAEDIRRKAERRATKRSLLELSPMAWLTTAPQGVGLVSGVVMLSALGVWLFLYGMYGKAMLRPMAVLLTGFWLNVFVALTGCYVAVRQMALDRRSGALELLLVTPVSAAELVAGCKLGVIVNLRRTWWLLAGVNLAFLALGLQSRDWNLRAGIAFTLAWATTIVLPAALFRGMIWEILWASVNSGRMIYSLLKPLQPMMGFILPLFWVHSGFIAKNFPTGSTGHIAGCAILFGVFLLLFKEYNGTARKEQLISELRLIAAEPVPEGNDPRLKKWNMQKRLGEVKGQAKTRRGGWRKWLRWERP